MSLTSNNFRRAPRSKGGEDSLTARERTDPGRPALEQETRLPGLEKGTAERRAKLTRPSDKRLPSTEKGYPNLDFFLQTWQDPEAGHKQEREHEFIGVSLILKGQHKRHMAIKRR